MRWLLIGIVWLYFLVLLVGPILYMASQSFSEGLAAFWTEISRPEALHGFTLTAEIAATCSPTTARFDTAADSA